MKKIGLKVVGAIFIILALVTTQVPALGTYANTDGSDVFEMNGQTLVKYTGTAKTVSVSDTVKVIGEEAFAGNEFVTEIKLPSSVEKISYRAFADCSSLEKVTTSDSIITIESGAFSNCISLKEFTIGPNCRDLGYGVFAGCDSLSKLLVSEYNTTFMYKDGLLYDDECKTLYCVLKGANLTKVSLPRTVENIMPYAFWGCDTIESIGLSEYIDYLEDYSLANLQNLESIIIPYSVEGIGLKTFADCIRLKDVTIHPTVKTIHESAFDGCVRLNIIAEPGSTAYKFYENMSSQPIIEEEYEDVEDIIYNIHDDIESIEDVVTGNKEGPNTTAEEKLLGTTVVSSGHAVILIDNTKQAVNVGNPYDDTKTDETNDNTNSNGSEMIGSVTELFSTTDVKGNTIPKYTIVNNEIAGRAYYGNQNMSGYTMPEEITRVNDFSFARSNLTSISIPSSVTQIGYGAFYHCDNLSQITIPTSVTDIEPFAFQNTKWLEDWYQTGQEFLIVGDGILLAYNGGNSHITIPDGVKKIAPYAFYQHNGLLSVSLPDSLVEVGEAAFSGCVNLTEVFGGTGILKIADRAFYDCPLQTVKISEEVTEIGLLAFDLSNGNREAKEKTAIFYGDALPLLSYEESSTRLSNDWYRDYALKDVLFAVVPSHITEYENTVLGDSDTGFKGLIVSVISEENATMELKESYLSNEEIQKLGITDKVTVFQKTYTISNFNEFFAENKLSSSEEINSDNKISVINKSDVLPLSESYDAVGVAFNGTYKLTIDELINETEISSFKSQYKRLYGEEMPENTCYLDMQLFEENCQVPISKIGKNTLEVTIPLPENLKTGTLHVVCLDSDGQLEEVAYTLDEENGEAVAKIQVKHFSPYALYSYKNNQFVAQAVVKDGEAVFTLGSGNLDESPDTGDYFEPKWLLVGGFGAIGIVLMLWKKKRL